MTRSTSRWALAAGLLLATACDSDYDSPSSDDGALAAAAPTSTAEESIAAIATVAPTSTSPVTTPVTTSTTGATGTSAATSKPATLPATSAPPVECPSVTPGVHEYTSSPGGADHSVRMFVPSAYDGSQLPAVIDWHGLGSNGPQQAAFSGYEEVAESNGFIVVHPTGVSDSPSGPNSWQLVGGQGATERDDLAFAGALIDDLVANWCADPARIYSTGMSNGGFFTARLICEMSDRIAAAVSVAGTYHPEECAPARPVPYIAIHGTDDGVVPFDGSGESSLITDDSPAAVRVFFTQVIPDEFAEFAADAGCDATPNETDVGDDVLRHDYVGCDGGTPMAFMEVIGGGHTWPGSPMASAVAGALGYTTDDIDATIDGWEFMSQYSLDS